MGPGLGDGVEVSSVKAVRVSALAVLPVLSVKVIVHMYSLSPLVLSVTVFDPDDTELPELSPHPAVPPTAIVPVSLTLITTLGVASEVSVATGAVSEG